jgi:hypothetical protein
MSEMTAGLPALPPAPDPEPPGLTEDRRAALGAMNPALRAKVLEIERRTDSEGKNLLESRYQTGRDMLEIKQNPKVYGATSDLQMAAYFGATYGETVFNEARRLAERYPPDKFKQLLEARNPETGYRVGLKVLTVLLRIEADAEADAVLDKAIAGSWNSRELAAYISRMARPSNPRGRRRPRLAGLPGLLENLCALSEQWLRSNEEDWQALRDGFDALPDARAIAAALAKAREAEAVARKVAESADSLSKELRACRRRAEAALRRAKEGESPDAGGAGGDGGEDDGEDDGE